MERVARDVSSKVASLLVHTKWRKKKSRSDTAVAARRAQRRRHHPPQSSVVLTAQRNKVYRPGAALAHHARTHTIHNHKPVRPSRRSAPLAAFLSRTRAAVEASLSSFR